MRNILISLSLLLAALNAPAFEAGETFTMSSTFWRSSTALTLRPSYLLGIGAEFDVTDHDAFKNHIYAARLPVAARLSGGFGVLLKPFYYHGNQDGLYAYGAKGVASFIIKQDDVEKTYTRADISAAFAAQKGDVLRSDTLEERASFLQAAYGLNLNFSFFDMYNFDVMGNIYQYSGGLDGVQAARAPLNQGDLGDLGTLDYTLALPDYAAGFKIGWLSAVSRSDNYISYRYINFHNANPTHSLLLSSLVNIRGGWFMNLAYNHLFQSAAGRDIFAASLMYKF